DIGARRLAPLEGEGAIDRAAEQDRRQNDRGVHNDAGHGPEDELPCDLPEVRPHLPEEAEAALSDGHRWIAGSSRSPVTRATITSRARLKCSLTAGTSSQ